MEKPKHTGPIDISVSLENGEYCVESDMPIKQFTDVSYVRMDIYEKLQNVTDLLIYELEQRNKQLADAIQSLSVYANGCDATQGVDCGYEGNLCCQTARTTLQLLGVAYDD